MGCRGAQRRGCGKEELDVRMDVRALPKGKKIGLSPRCYYPASSNLCNPLSGSWGDRNRSKSRHPNPAFFPADRSRRRAPAVTAAARPSCLPGPQLLSNLAAKRTLVPAHSALRAAGRLLACSGSAGMAGQGASAPTRDFFLGRGGGLGLQGVRHPHLLVGRSLDIFCCPN